MPKKCKICYYKNQLLTFRYSNTNVQKLNGKEKPTHVEMRRQLICINIRTSYFEIVTT